MENNHSILVVDDEPILLDITKSYLEFFGHSFETAENGRTALEKLAQMYEKGRLPSLVLSNIMMPDIDGIEFYRISRKLYPNLPFILMSEHNPKKEEMGGIPYLEKPFKHEELKTKIEEVLNS